jgi:protein-S-isoprenylcysteine O-methyltransferase Ste14
MNRSLNIRALRASVGGAAVMAGLLFVPAGTFDYWQAWLFMAVFVGSSSAVTVYLAMRDPILLERRMRVGPTAEIEPKQKILMLFAMVGFIALLVLPAADHRFGWSPVPSYVSLAADALMGLSFLLIFFVLKANTYGASTIQVTDGQQVISTGPYALVRHPMYAAALPLLVGMPLALDSWWGLFVLIAFVPTLIGRLLDEERFLREHLPGYTSYCNNVRYRLVPLVW